MSETLTAQPGTAEWQNATNEQIVDPAKAEHMAHIENAWREKAKDLGKMAVEMHDFSLERGNEQYMADNVSDSYLKAKDEAMTQYGPQAVEDMGKAYDAVHGEAFLPPEDRQQINKY